MGYIIWVVWWMCEPGDTPGMEVFTDHDEAYACWRKHYEYAYECDMEQYTIYPKEVAE